MRYEIRPYEGVDSLKLGASRDEIHNMLGAPSRSFLKAGTSLTDEYQGLGLFVYYDSEKKAEAFEFFPPASPTLQSHEILGRPFDEVRNWFREADPDMTVDGTGLTSPRFGVGVYASSALKKPHDPVEGVIVYRKDYYDSGQT